MQGVSSAEMRERVGLARMHQQRRGFYNAHIPNRQLRELCALDEAGERTLEMAVRRMSLSARAHDRILKVARTIADLGKTDQVSAKHVAEAVQYRSLDRNYWGNGGRAFVSTPDLQNPLRRAPRFQAREPTERPTRSSPARGCLPS